MTDYNTKNSLGSLATDFSIFVAGTYYEPTTVLFDEATATYTPALGDIFCYKSDDTNKHQKYDRTDAALVIMGIIADIEEDNTGTPVVQITHAKNCSVHWAALGYTGTMNAAQKLALKLLLRAKNINLVD